MDRMGTQASPGPGPGPGPGPEPMFATRVMCCGWCSAR
jgi:hypothetical protein